MNYELRRVDMHYEIWDRGLERFMGSYDLGEYQEALRDLESLE